MCIEVSVLPFCERYHNVEVVSTGSIKTGPVTAVFLENSLQVVDTHITCGCDCFVTSFSPVPISDV